MALVKGSITIKDLWDGLDVDSTDKELSINAGDYKTATEVDEILEFMENGFICEFKPKGGKVVLRFKSAGLIPITCMIKYGKKIIRRVRVPINGIYDLEINFKSNLNQIVYMYGNIALHTLQGQLVDILQWGTVVEKDGNKIIGASKLVGGEKIFKDFPMIKWTALDTPNFEYLTNMNEFCLGSKLNIDMSDWNVSNVNTHDNFIDDTNESILPDFPIVPGI